MKVSVPQVPRRVVMIIVCALLHGCVSEPAVWTETTANPTESGFAAYIDRYPNGEHIADAQSALEELRWQHATADSTENAYQHFIELHPNGEHIADAREALEELLWQDAQSADSLDLLQRYLALYPEGQFRDAAEERIRGIEAEHSHPIVQKSEWIPSFRLEDYTTNPSGIVSEINSTRYAREGKRLLSVEGELYFPPGMWDLARIFLRANDGNDYALLAFSYIKGTYSSAERGEVVTVFGNQLRRVSLGREIRETYQVGFPVGRWPGGTFGIGLIFELPVESQPTLLLHGMRSHNVAAER